MPDETHRRYLFVAIKTIQTDNGSQFADRFTTKSRLPSGQQGFDLALAWSSASTARISELICQTRFRCAAELDDTLMRYLSTSNNLIPQRALKHLSPVQALKQWQHDKPELFNKRVYQQPGLDA